MSVDLPAPVAAYFAADGAKDADAVARCFVEDAVVRDENHVHRGRAAIRQWTTDASTRFTYVVEPFSIETVGDRTVVTSRLTGDFPGSPTDLRYFFALDGGQIAELEIIP
jgi:ketosteroid isomerase-like protein